MTQNLINKANTLRDAGRVNAARKILIPLLKAKNYQVACNANDALGICFMNEDNFTKAIRYYKKAFEIAEKNRWRQRLSGIARNIAIAYKNSKKYKEAEKWFLKSLEFVKKYSDEGQGKNASLGITYTKLGLLYTDRKNYQKAARTLEQGINFLRKSSHDYWKLIGAIDRCYFYLATKKYKNMEQELPAIISDAIEQNKEYKLIEALILAGDAEKGLKNLLAANQFYNLAKLVLRIFDSKEVIKKFQEEIDQKIRDLSFLIKKLQKDKQRKYLLQQAAVFLEGKSSRQFSKVIRKL